MGKSKDIIRPHLPRDMSNQKIDGEASEGLTPGVLVVRGTDRALEKCDTTNINGDPSHVHTPVEMIWTDGTSRNDDEFRKMDGSLVYLHTALQGQFTADVAKSVFEGDAPSPGDVIIKSLNNVGEFSAQTPADVEALTESATQIDGLTIGKVISAGEESGFVRCSFDLG